MIPKKISKLYQPVAEDLNIEESLVEHLMEFYYKALKNQLSNLSHPRINVEGLGHFVVRPGMVKKSITRYSKALENHDTSTFSAYHNKRIVENKLELLIEMERKLILQEEDKHKLKEKKDEYIKNNLGEQETDSGGNN